MKKPHAHPYRNRVIILVAGFLLLTITMLRVKLLPTWKRWQAQRLAETESVVAPALLQQVEQARLRKARLEQLQSRMPDGGLAGIIQRAAEGSYSGTALATVHEEHIATANGLIQRTLPLALTGRTENLLNAIATIEHEARAVRILSLDLHAKAANYKAPRSLSATLYLQTAQQP